MIQHANQTQALAERRRQSRRRGAGRVHATAEESRCTNRAQNPHMIGDLGKHPAFNFPTGRQLQEARQVEGDAPNGDALYNESSGYASRGHRNEWRIQQALHTAQEIKRQVRIMNCVVLHRHQDDTLSPLADKWYDVLPVFSRCALCLTSAF